eukprot:CAMPEP_0171678790 /NCGR_PEP_ID=MMETSP0990-20121206/55872_1 /TAXON_ID=483369 /ORGANISM="non described non described, Strain CCMP2098" /LENGTH=94 /DNA_ID=CAMNT_0012265493 /DNA_START=204 /DNA_END=488 /DNA_ORIENTATION=+
MTWLAVAIAEDAALWNARNSGFRPAKFTRRISGKTAQPLFELQECDGGRDACPNERPGLGTADDLRVGVGEFHGADPVRDPRRRKGLGLGEALR